MSYTLVKRNRLNGKFGFKRRDWQFELDGTDDFPPLPLRSGRPKKAKRLRKFDGGSESQQTAAQSAG